jgi:hypothetical protein
MSINYIKAVSATLPTGSATVTVTGEYVDFSKSNDYLLALDNGSYVLPVLSGTAPDANGDSTLTLVDTWGGATLTDKSLMIFPTFAKIYESVTAMTALNDVTRGILTKLKDTLTATTPTIDVAIGQTSSVQVVPLGYLAEQFTLLSDEMQGAIDAVAVIESTAAAKADEASASALAASNTAASVSQVVSDAVTAKGLAEAAAVSASGDAIQTASDRTATGQDVSASASYLSTLQSKLKVSTTIPTASEGVDGDIWFIVE